MGRSGPGETWIVMSWPSEVDLELVSTLCCVFGAAVRQLPCSTSAVGGKTPLSVYGRAERAPG